MKQLVAIFILVMLCQKTLAQEKQIPDTMTIKRFSQLDSGRYFFIYSESPKDSLHLGLDGKLKCPVIPACPTCPTCPTLVSLTIDLKTGLGIAVYNNGLSSTITLTSSIIIK